MNFRKKLSLILHKIGGDSVFHLLLPLSVVGLRMLWNCWEDDRQFQVSSISPLPLKSCPFTHLPMAAVPSCPGKNTEKQQLDVKTNIKEYHNMGGEKIENILFHNVRQVRIESALVTCSDIFQSL